jgi:hypothetical protein
MMAIKSAEMELSITQVKVINSCQSAFTTTFSLDFINKHKVGHNNRAKTRDKHQQQPTFITSSPICTLGVTMPNLDAHARPPEVLRQQYKHYQKASIHALDNDPDLFDISRPNLSACSDRNFLHHPPDDIINIYSTFLSEPVDTLPPSVESARLYEHPDLPGMTLSENGSQNSFLSLW